MTTDDKKPMTPAETALLNEALFEKLAARDPVLGKEAEDAVNAFTMQRMRDGLDDTYASGRRYFNDDLAINLPPEQQVARADEIASQLMRSPEDRWRHVLFKMMAKCFFLGKPQDDFRLQVQERLEHPENYAVVNTEEDEGPEYPHWEMNTPGGLRWQDLREDKTWPGGHRILPPIPISNDELDRVDMTAFNARQKEREAERDGS